MSGISTAYAALEVNRPHQHPWDIVVVTPATGHRERQVCKLDAGRVVATPSGGVDAAAADAVLAEGGWTRVCDWVYTGGGLYSCTVVPSSEMQPSPA